MNAKLGRQRVCPCLSVRPLLCVSSATLEHYPLVIVYISHPLGTQKPFDGQIYSIPASLYFHTLHLYPPLQIQCEIISLSSNFCSSSHTLPTRAGIGSLKSEARVCLSALRMKIPSNG